MRASKEWTCLLLEDHSQHRSMTAPVAVALQLAAIRIQEQGSTGLLLPALSY